jgi:hypothetical protein
MSETNRKRYKPRLYVIEFGGDHPDFADLEAKVKGASVDTLLELMAVADLAQDVAETAAVTITEAHKKAVEVMIRELAGLITWWNVDDEHGRPVAPDEAGLRSQDFAMVMAIFERWSARFAAVAPPLRDGSAPGPSAEELAEIPMGSLPASPPS